MSNKKRAISQNILDSDIFFDRESSNDPDPYVKQKLLFRRVRKSA